MPMHACVHPLVGGRCWQTAASISSMCLPDCIGHPTAMLLGYLTCLRFSLAPAVKLQCLISVCLSVVGGAPVGLLSRRFPVGHSMAVGTLAHVVECALLAPMSVF
jgi:hypothetical protein